MRMEREKVARKTEIERARIIEKAASADQEFEAQQMQSPEDINLE
jgi:hypothetical protein